MQAFFGSLPCDGDRIGVSDWKRISQGRIDRFAQATDDFQFVHVDPLRAARETPFEGTIAHGFLTLSLVSALAADAIPTFASLRSAVIVGIDRIRFKAPVGAERRIRGRFFFKRASWLSEDRVLLKILAEIEIEGQGKPALSGEFSWLCTLHEAADRPMRLAAEMTA